MFFNINIVLEKKIVSNYTFSNFSIQVDTYQLKKKKIYIFIK